MSVPVQGVLFDKDGTLFDFNATWGVWAVGLVDDLAKGDADIARALAQGMKLDLQTKRFDPQSPVIAGTPEEIAAAILPFAPGWEAAALLDHMNTAAALAPQVPVLPLVPFFERLRSMELKVGVATNDAEAPARAHLGAHDAERLLDFISGYDSGFGAKPGPGPCLAFADAMGLAPEQCAMVGDSLHDLHAGRAAGMKTVAVLTGIAQAETLEPHADVVLPDIGHLPDWIRQLPR